VRHLAPFVIAALAIGFAVWRRRRGLPQPQGALRLPVNLPTGFGGDVGLIAAREIRQRLRGRIFRVVTVLMLAGVAAAIVIPALTKSPARAHQIGLVGTVSAADRAALQATGSSAGGRAVLRPEAGLASAERALRDGRLDLVVVDGRRVLTNTTLTSGDTSSTAQLARAVAAGLGVEHAAGAAGITPGQLAQLRHAGPLPVVGLQPARAGGTERGVAIVGIILLFVLLTQYNTWTLIGVMEEKSSRVVEVLLATVRPLHLLTGKVLGIGLLVFAQAGLVVGFALALAAGVGSNVLHGAGPALIISILVWLVLGYAFYCWVYAAAGSLAERQDQVQSLALPIAIPMIVAYVWAINVASSGHPSTAFEVLAYLPPTAPFAMPMLVGLGTVSWWQVALSALISVVATLGVMRLAASVYRRAVLRTGRRVRLRELFAAAS
jgi:ABC-2 type transport system permease protein